MSPSEGFNSHQIVHVNIEIVCKIKLRLQHEPLSVQKLVRICLFVLNLNFSIILHMPVTVLLSIRLWTVSLNVNTARVLHVVMVLWETSKFPNENNSTTPLKMSSFIHRENERKISIQLPLRVKALSFEIDIVAEIAFAELWGFVHTDSLRLICRQRNFYGIYTKETLSYTQV